MSTRLQEPVPPTGAERRRRRRVESPARCHLGGLSGTVVDISRAGCALELPACLPPRARLDVEIRDEAGEACSFAAEVVWCDGEAPCRAGLLFRDLTPAQDAWLARRFVAWLRREMGGDD